MPLLKYFAVMGSVLIALLFVADAMLAKPERPVFTSKFDTDKAVALVGSEGKPAPAPAPPHIATVPMETTPAATVAAATPAVVEKPGEVKVEAKTEIRNEPRKKKVRVARQRPKANPADDEWADNSWGGNSWDDNSWKSHSRRNNSWRNRESRDAYAYEPHRQQQDFWFR